MRFFLVYIAICISALQCHLVTNIKILIQFQFTASSLINEYTSFLVLVNDDFTDSIYARCACLGEVLTFTCTIFDSGDGATVWSGSAFDCNGNEITLIHRNFDRGTLGGCNDQAIIGESIGVSDNRTCFTSRLNVTVNTGLNNKTVNCSNSGIRNIGLSTITIAGKYYSIELQYYNVHAYTLRIPL